MYGNIQKSLYDLAVVSASSLARASIRDIELREAISTEETSSGVRIGKYEIILNQETHRPTYDILDLNDTDVVSGIYFYDCAREIVRMLNLGRTLRNSTVSRILQANEEYHRALADEATYKSRVAYYLETHNYDKADIMDNRLSDVRGRVDELRHKLTRNTLS